jgi:hypothetical protein
MLNVCTFPKLRQAPPNPTVTPTTNLIFTATETATPQTDSAYSACYFNWAQEVLPELSREFDAALKGIHPLAEGYAEAYGEDCINPEGEVVYFVAMETDFYLTFQVKDLGDKQALGNLVEQVMDVLANFPAEETPGPQPGIVGITFETPDDTLRLWVTRTEAETAIENGLGGEELIETLQAK